MKVVYDKKWLLDYCKYLPYKTEKSKNVNLFGKVTYEDKKVFIDTRKIGKPIWDMCLYYLNAKEGEDYLLEHNYLYCGSIFYDLKNEITIRTKQDYCDTTCSAVLPWANKEENILLGSILHYCVSGGVYVFEDNSVVDLTVVEQEERIREGKKQERNRFCKMFGGD